MIRPAPELRQELERLVPPVREPAAGALAKGRQTDPALLDRSLDRLVEGSRQLARLSLEQRIAIFRQCFDSIQSISHEWVEQSCRAKGIPTGAPQRAEEILAGPAAVFRQLQLFLRTMRDVSETGAPRIPRRIQRRANGQIGVRVTPCPGLWDPVTFFNFKSTAWLLPDISEENLRSTLAPGLRSLDQTGVSLVLGAGNVSGIPAADMLTKLCADNRTVLLKMNPVNEYLGPIFEQAFAPLIEHHLLRVVYGDVSVGAAAIKDPRVSDVHVTGSEATYNAIVWGADREAQQTRMAAGQPVLDKPITSELGSVTPWIMVPGGYSPRQLRFQAENIVASLTNNAAFNCVATRVIVTWKQWPERERFLQLLEGLLSRIPQRVAYYPGAIERYEQFAGISVNRARGLLSASPTQGTMAGRMTSACGSTVFVAGTEPGDNTLPWTLLRNVHPDADSPLLSRESFCCVCAEVPIDASSPEDFLARATEFVNTRLWGTLAVSITMPQDFRRAVSARNRLEESLEKLRYGVVCLNHWAGVAFALMSPPWGGHPGSTPRDIQSGTGWVHNSLMLSGIEKTVVEGPLVVQPRAVWLPTHPRPESVARALSDLFRNPSYWNLNKVAWQAVRAGLQ